MRSIFLYTQIYNTDLIGNLCFRGITIAFNFNKICSHWGIANNDLKIENESLLNTGKAG